MFATLVHVHVEQKHIADFIEATRLNHDQSIQEPGNLRFDILQDDSDPSKFILYEVYTSQEAVNGHKETPHYLQWRDTVAPWMSRPREGKKHTLLFPSTK